MQKRTHQHASKQSCIVKQSRSSKLSLAVFVWLHYSPCLMHQVLWAQNHFRSNLAEAFRPFCRRLDRRSTEKNFLSSLISQSNTCCLLHSFGEAGCFLGRPWSSILDWITRILLCINARLYRSNDLIFDNADI
jgi:hypothetical protein